jgi:hypothetical protein
LAEGTVEAVEQEDQSQLRREFRAWVHEHHPDAGGDLEEFTAGMKRWHEVLHSQSAEEAPTGVFRRLWRRGSGRS